MVHILHIFLDYLCFPLEYKHDENKHKEDSNLRLYRIAVSAMSRRVPDTQVISEYFWKKGSNGCLLILDKGVNKSLYLYGFR